MGVEELGRGVDEIICFEKIVCLNGHACGHGFIEAVTNQDLPLGMRLLSSLGLEMASIVCLMARAFVFLPRGIAHDPARTEA